MNKSALDERLIARWQAAAQDLGIQVTAPVTLRDASGEAFDCEVFVHDFGSPAGALVVSARTERRIRAALRSLGPDLWVCTEGNRGPETYIRKHFVDVLRDWGWFGAAGDEPDWFR